MSLLLFLHIIFFSELAFGVFSLAPFAIEILWWWNICISTMQFDLSTLFSYHLIAIILPITFTRPNTEWVWTTGKRIMTALKHIIIIINFCNVLRFLFGLLFVHLALTSLDFTFVIFFWWFVLAWCCHIPHCCWPKNIVAMQVTNVTAPNSKSMTALAEWRFCYMSTFNF